MKIINLKGGSTYQRHNDQVTYNIASPQEDVVYGDEVRKSLQTIEIPKKMMPKNLKEMMTSNEELWNTGRIRMKCRLQPKKYRRLK